MSRMISPCPFCGSGVTSLSPVPEIPEGHQIVCRDCKARGPECKFTSGAITLWNEAPRQGVPGA